MNDKDLDPVREEGDPGYLEDAAVENDNDETEPEDQRALYVHDPEVHGRDYRVEGNDVRDYYGVDPEYRTYANDTDKPIMTDTERFTFTDQYDHLVGNHSDDEVDSAPDAESDVLSEEEVRKYDGRAREIVMQLKPGESMSWYAAIRQARDEDMEQKSPAESSEVKEDQSSVMFGPTL
jgi:hypothetical protein